MKANEFAAGVLLLLIAGWAFMPAAFGNGTPGCTSGASCAVSGIPKTDSTSQAIQAPTPQGEAELKEFKISVERGYYNPRKITVNQGDKVRIVFDQKSFVGCMVVFNIYDLGIRTYVPNTPYLEFVADRSGTFKTGCNMGMGDGQFIVLPSQEI